MNVIRSKNNARVKTWIRLAADAKERRRRGLALIEGIHLVETLLSLGRSPVNLIVSESAAVRLEIGRIIERASLEPVVLADAVFNRIAGTDTPVGIAAEIEFSETKVDPAMSASCLFLDGIQDAGNIGTLLRSAAAFGVPDVMLGRGCADPWSPKALRAGMGGQFSLRIAASTDLAGDIRRFGDQSICTVVQGGAPVESIDLTGRIGWIFGGEGSGISDEVAALATLKATIVMPGGAESLNVAASAAICLYERSRQISRHGARS